MANTGYKQAIIAYKVRASDGVALDINDDPINESGRKQAIALLVGKTNPNPALYEVQFYFAADASVEGEPTTEVSDDCKTGYIFITPTPGVSVLLSLANPTAAFTVTSSAPWTVSAPAGIVVTPTTGPRDSTAIVLSRSGNGQGVVTFTNTFTGQTATLYAISVDSITWILATGVWNPEGFWLADGIWNTI